MTLRLMGRSHCHPIMQLLIETVLSQAALARTGDLESCERV